MSAHRPNIIYILSDDHRADYVGCMGHPILRTPHLDQLARDGVLFTQAFCTSPACTPSRACHYTGQWERKHGVNFNSNSSLAPAAWENSFPMRLKEAGYFLGWVGKNHMPVGEGGYQSGYLESVFDYWYGNHGHSEFYVKETPQGVGYRNATSDTQVEIFAEGVNNFLNPQQSFTESGRPPLPLRPHNQPFCLCLTFNLPHGVGTGTMQLRPTDDELYRSAYRDQIGELPLPKTYRTYDESVHSPRLPHHVYSNRRIAQYDYVKLPGFLKERQVRTCQVVTGIDRMIGHLRKTLTDMGLADDTIIIYSTDHGLHHGEHGLGGKCFLYEEDLHIPLIVYDPRAQQGKRGQIREEFVLVPDLAPTVLDLAGVDIPDSMQGQSLAPLIQGDTPRWREDFFAEQLLDIQDYPRSECVRNKEWKYIRYFRRSEDETFYTLDGTYGTKDNYIDALASTLNDERPIYEELFHLDSDPNEETNLAGNPVYQHVLEALRARIHTLGKEALGASAGPLTIPLDRRYESE
ncbi:MAG: sulfatase-like hydrolase/transferase [Chloroflexi bacterium]|nr:sulfatase-like hydrolase/transferase [Chloroflexota bacterium]